MHLPYFGRRVMVSSGRTWLDIDAVACMIAYARLLRILGYDAHADLGSPDRWNASITQTTRTWLPPVGYIPDDPCEHALMDISDPHHITTEPENVREVYDHHSGYEMYWQKCIGEHAHIDLIGAAATLIYEAYERHGHVKDIDPPTANLLLTAILSNTSNFQMGYVDERDRRAYRELQRIASVPSGWEEQYFREMQAAIESDPEGQFSLDQKVFGKIRFAQGEVYDSESFLEHISLEHIRAHFDTIDALWLYNIIDIRTGTSHLIVGDDTILRERVARGIAMDVPSDGIFRLPRIILRKEYQKIFNFS